MSTVLDPREQLGALAQLIGVWEGEGEGSWARGAVFRYRERVSFAHGGKPLLSYAQQTWALDDGRPLHTEQGFWRAGSDGAVELVLAHGIGVAEVEIGRWDGHGLRTRSIAMTLTPSAKNVTAVERVFSIDAGVFAYTLDMAIGGGDVRPHLSAALRRS